MWAMKFFSNFIASMLKIPGSRCFRMEAEFMDIPLLWQTVFIASTLLSAVKLLNVMDSIVPFCY
jgi:hypothetical protein